jgi:hypothetical protein
MAKLRVPDDRGVTHIDDLQDAIAGHRPARARIATRLAGPRVGAFWKPDVDIIAGASLARRTVNPPLSIVKSGSGYRAGLSSPGSGAVSKKCLGSLTAMGSSDSGHCS